MGKDISVGELVVYKGRCYEVLDISTNGFLHLGNGSNFLKRISLNEVQPIGSYNISDKVKY